MTEENRKPEVALALGGDSLDREVSIRAQVDASGLTIGGKSRALAAFDMLVGGVLGTVAERAEGLRQRTRLREQIRTDEVEGRRFLALGVSGEPDSVRARAAQRLIADEVRKQLNREAVWENAAAEMKALPAPKNDQPAGDRDDTAAIDDDWLGLFATHAERASSERLRRLWGQILSGEIRNPGSFSLSTIRIISELDIEIASAFQKITRLRLGRTGDVILRQPKLQGADLIELTFLQEVGLLQEVNGSLELKNGKGHARLRLSDYEGLCP